MSQHLNDIFEGKQDDVVQSAEAERPEQTAAAPAGDPTAEQPAGQPAGGATAAPEDNGRVPLAALEDERKKRQDWKEKALRYEGELKAMRENATQQPQGEQRQQDPMAMMQQQIVNERFNHSEMAVKAKYDEKEVDEMVELFSQHCQGNPALQAELANQRHPWLFAYTEGKKLKAMADMGGDPASYRDKLRAELEAQIRAELGGQQSNPDATTAKPTIPASLAGARSSAARSAPSFTGPTPLGSMFQ